MIDHHALNKIRKPNSAHPEPYVIPISNNPTANCLAVLISPPNKGVPTIIRVGIKNRYYPESKWAT